MKDLNRIFSKKDMEQLAKYVSGWKPGRMKVELVKYDEKAIGKLGMLQQAFVRMDHPCDQELVATVRCGIDMQVVVFSSGEVAAMNMHGVRFKIAEPLKAYSLVLDRFSKAGPKKRWAVHYRPILKGKSCVWGLCAAVEDKTNDPAKVTCKTCLRAMDRLIGRGHG
jgi:hypothetical protein